MSKTTSKIELNIAAKAERRELAKAKLLEGSIGALSLDTCIFTEAGYRLEGGMLKRLEQFNRNSLRLVFSDVTIREIYSHIVENADESKKDLTNALRSIGKSWLIPPDRQASAINELLGLNSAKEKTEIRMKDFKKRSGYTLIRSKASLDVEALLNRYFNVQSPFNNSEDKKAEFPDAIALLSIQAWAKSQATIVLFVTKDKGCQRFCLESEHLVAIDDLDDALELIQERNTYHAELCKSIELKIAQGKYPNLSDEVRKVISENIWDIDWMPEADSAFYYEPEMQEVDVVDVSLIDANGCATLKVVDFQDDVLVVQATVTLQVDASCGFSFSVKDGIDRDMVNIGDATVNQQVSVDVDVLLSFENPSSDVPLAFEIELVPFHHRIDFGLVEPDYSHEDPNAEGY